MPELTTSASIIDVAGGKVIAEHVGRVAICTPALGPGTVHREDEA